MTRYRRLLHTIALYVLPVVVAALGLGVTAAVVLVIGMLAVRWAIVLTGFSMPEMTAALELETISVSHYVEKVRWCMDRLGVDYAERQCGGTLGAFFVGRTVPLLRIKTGAVLSVIGNSPEILRYLWGQYAATLGDQAEFLAPTKPRLDLEHRLDRYGRNLQVWVYYHLLPDRELTLHAWGAENPQVPAWHRLVLHATYPLLAVLVRRAFAITDEHCKRSVLYIEELLSDVDTRLADGRRSILGGDEINYTDLTFAALTGLWMQPDGYAGGKAEQSRIERSRMPAPMRADVERWLEDFPKATTFVQRLYAEER